MTWHFQSLIRHRTRVQHCVYLTYLNHLPFPILKLYSQHGESLIVDPADK
jgi:hypothetical protein